MLLMLLRMVWSRVIHRKLRGAPQQVANV